MARLCLAMARLSLVMARLGIAMARLSLALRDAPQTHNRGVHPAEILPFLDRQMAMAGLWSAFG